MVAVAIVAAYLLTGTLLARKITPLSWPLKHNAVMITLLWPWPIAALIVYRITGTYPKWTPFI